MRDNQILARIKVEAQRIMGSEPGIRAILLAGSYARGTPWPRSDVDLFAITETGSLRVAVVDVDWTTYDTTYTTVDALEAQMAQSFITCNSCLDLITLLGNPGIAQQIQTTARRLYGQHVSTGPALLQLREQLRKGVQRLHVARGNGEIVAQALEGAGLVWLAGRLCLSMAGIGPIREDQWHDVLATANLPFDAATPYACWHLGTVLAERLDAAMVLAEKALDDSLVQPPIVTDPVPSPPPVTGRTAPEAAEAVEMHRLIAAVGFGKMAKAEWLEDELRQASEAGAICWFAVPALLALGGIDPPAPRWWHDALCKASLPFDAATLYAQALVGPSFLERKEAAVALGHQALHALEAIFRDTPSAQKYRR
jgi:predicted nucleotidyltransferase